MKRPLIGAIIGGIWGLISSLKWLSIGFETRYAEGNGLIAIPGIFLREWTLFYKLILLPTYLLCLPYGEEALNYPLVDLMTSPYFIIYSILIGAVIGGTLGLLIKVIKETEITKEGIEISIKAILVFVVMPILIILIIWLATFIK